MGAYKEMKLDGCKQERRLKKQLDGFDKFPTSHSSYPYGCPNAVCHGLGIFIMVVGLEGAGLKC